MILRGRFANTINGSEGLSIAAEFGAVEPTLLWLEKHRADLALVDLGLPDDLNIATAGQLTIEVCSGAKGFTS